MLEHVTSVPALGQMKSLPEIWNLVLQESLKMLGDRKGSQRPLASINCELNLAVDFNNQLFDRVLALLQKCPYVPELGVDKFVEALENLLPKAASEIINETKSSGSNKPSPPAASNLKSKMIIDSTSVKVSSVTSRTASTTFKATRTAPSPTISSRSVKVNTSNATAAAKSISTSKAVTNLAKSPTGKSTQKSSSPLSRSGSVSATSAPSDAKVTTEKLQQIDWADEDIEVIKAVLKGLASLPPTTLTRKSIRDVVRMLKAPSYLLQILDSLTLAERTGIVRDINKLQDMSFDLSVGKEWIIREVYDKLDELLAYKCLEETVHLAGMVQHLIKQDKIQGLLSATVKAGRVVDAAEVIRMYCIQHGKEDEMKDYEEDDNALVVCVKSVYLDHHRSND
jgi:hypothetical protein